MPERAAQVILLPMSAPDPRAVRLQPSVSDADLVLRAREGDAWARGAIFRRYVEDVTNLATRLLGRLGDADDAVQDTFVDAFEALHSLRQPESLRSWLLGIAVRRVQRRIRRTRMLRRFGLDHGTDDATLARTASADASPEARTELAQIDAILARVPVDARIAWIMRRVEDEELAVVATAIGVSLATVKRRIDEVDDLLRESVGRERRPRRARRREEAR